MNCRNWCEIDIKKIKNNYVLMKDTIVKGQRVMAVVKANAYGHGIVEVAKSLQSVGCDFFAVATVEEGVNLRENGIKGEILILGYTPSVSLSQIVDFNLSQVIYSNEYAEVLRNSKRYIKTHFAFDTGMNRLGFSEKDDFNQILEKYSKYFQIEGVYTHLSSADNLQDEWFTKMQINKFKNMVKSLKIAVKYVHFANSSGALRYNDNIANVVRLGGCVYGLGDCPRVTPALRWKSVVVTVKSIDKGDFVGYGLSFCAERKMRIATIACGYADGYFRGLSNVGKVAIKGKLAPIVGNICMDYFMVDVSQIEKVDVGEEVVLIGEEYTAKEMAKSLSTIDYEITCNISSRVDKIYFK